MWREGSECACVCVCVNLYKINRLCREDQVIEIAQLGLVMSWLCQEHMSRWSVLLYADATSSLLCKHIPYRSMSNH